MSITLVSIAWGGADVLHDLYLLQGPLLEAAAPGAKDMVEVGANQEFTEWPEPGGDLTVSERNWEELCCQQQEVGEK